MMRVLTLTAMMLIARTLHAEVNEAGLATQVLPPKDQPVVVESYEAEVQDNHTIITVRLSKKPNVESVSLEDHGTFMQIALPQSIVPKPGEFTDVKTPYVSKLVGFQTLPETASIRMFVSKEANFVKRASTVDVLDTQIVVSIDHKKLEDLIKEDPSVTAQSKNMPTAQEVIAKTEVDKDIPEPASILKDDLTLGPEVSRPAAALAFKDVSGLNKKLAAAAGFCTIMLLGLGVVYLFKPRLKRFKAMPENYAEFAMKTLATHKVSPKQRLELIDIGGEKILIAIGPDQVNFLTTVGQQHATALPPQLAKAPVLQQATLPHKVAAKTVAPKAVAAPTPAPQPQRRIVTPAKTQQVARQSAAATNSATLAPKRTGRIATQVGDDITMDYRKESIAKETNNQSISDVTKLIREKLKNLPSI